MDHFVDALLNGDGNKIPEEYDWFAPLIGDWDFDYHDGYGADWERDVKGEWIFRRVLDGIGIQDLFICPSRETRITEPQPDGEYGMAIRMFNKEDKCYDMVYTCEGNMSRLRFEKEGNKLVGTVLDEPSSKWVFSEIREETFRWQAITVLESGEWQVNSNVYAKRKE